MRYRRMVSAALSAMEGRSSENISMDEIARSAGVGKATLYRYFATKEGLLRACLRDVVDELGERIEAAEEGPGTAGERLKTIIGIMVETFSHHLLPLRLLTRRQADMDEHWRLAVGEARERLIRVLRRNFERGGVRGEYRRMDPGLDPYLVMGMIRSGVTHTTGVSNRVITDRIHALLVDGNRPRGNGAAGRRGAGRVDT